jgi:endonuclease G
MRFKIVWLAAALLCASFSNARNADASCATEYLGGAPPRVTSRAISVRELCFDAFAVGHSGATRTPLWSAEHLTAAEVLAAHALPRHDTFHAERQLPTIERAALSDYAHSGFDRGHVAPSGDMPTAEAQAQSFSLANMTPQTPDLNRGVWEQIETATRDLALEDGDLYVVSGPVVLADATSLHGRVRVPSAMFKAIYDPRTGAAAAYIADNDAHPAYRIISINTLRTMIGVDVFPTLPESVKRRAGSLPVPGRMQVASAEHHPPPALQR